MPQQFLQKIAGGAHTERILAVEAVGRLAHLLLALVQRHLFKVVVLGIEHAQAHVLYRLVLHTHDAEATIVVVVGREHLLQFGRQRTLCALLIHQGDAVERQAAHLLFLVHTDDVPTLLEEPHKSGRQGDGRLHPVGRGVAKPQPILLVDGSEDVVEQF